MMPIRPTSTKPKGSPVRAWVRSQDGGVAVTVAVMSAVLVGVLAIAIDLGRAYNLSTELDNAADAYALAGATQLDQEPGACTRAIQAAINANLANTETFASNNSGSDVYIDPTLNPFSNTSIRFMERIRKDADGNIIGDYIDSALGAGEQGTVTSDPADCDANARHIEVTINQASQGEPYRVDYSFAALVGAAAESFPMGYAIAESADLTCGFVPMMMCPVNPPGEGPPGDAFTWFQNHIETYEYTGYGLWMKAGTNSTQWGSGNFGFLRVGDVQGAQALGEAIGMVNPPLLCLGTDSIETEPGNNTGARQAFNTRFDIWHGSLSSEMSNPEWQPAVNQVKGRYRTDGGCANPDYNNPATEYAGPSTSPTLPDPQRAMSYPRDDCAYGGGCTAVDNLGRLGDGVWDIASYLNIMHPEPRVPPRKNFPDDSSNNQWNPDWDGNGYNQANDSRISRYEMYLWELGRPYEAAFEATPGDVDYGCDPGFSGSGTPCDLVDLPDQSGGTPGPLPYPQTGEYGGIQCFGGQTGHSGLSEPMRHDRRVVQLLVVDCDNIPGGLKGKTDIPDEYVAGTIDLFIVEPWKVSGSEHEIYMEIIGPGEATGVQQTVARTIVWLNE